MQWFAKRRKMLGLSLALTLGLGGVASASIAPFGQSPLFGGGGGGGTFYDFESVFSDSGGPLDGILSGGFGGMLGDLEGILGGNGSDYDTGCGLVIMNFAPSGGSDNCGSGTVFGGIFEQVGGAIGLPDGIMGVITGRTQPQNILSTILEEELSKIGLPGGLGGADSAIGEQGIPEPEELLASIFNSSHERTFGNVATLGGPLPSPDSGERSLNLLTPGVNTTLTNDVLTLQLLTTAVTNRGLSKAGQEITGARNTAAQVSSQASGQIGNASMEMAAKQLEAASQMSDTVSAQTSTQDTLKEGINGMNLLQAQSTQLAAQSNTQQALSTQIDGVGLQVSQEMRDGVFANGISLKTLNDQVSEESQKSLAQASSLRVENERSLRMLGAMR